MFVFIFLIPNDPVCQEEADNILENRTDTTITLNFTSLNKINSGEKLCVKIKLSTGASECKPVIAPAMTLTNSTFKQIQFFCVFIS